MKRRMTSATLVAAMLLLGSFAIPASAQDAEEGPQVGDPIDGITAEVCAEAIAAAYGFQNRPVFDENFAEFFQGGNPNAAVLEANQQGLLDAVVAFVEGQGQDFGEDLCSIYIDVAPIVIPPPEPPVTPPAPPQQPTEVAGVTLTQTGANTALLGLAGLVLLGLGVVAVRRTRSEVGAR
jgi:LPXTG-motif cell wall-anchored protein